MFSSFSIHLPLYVHAVNVMCWKPTLLIYVTSAPWHSARHSILYWNISMQILRNISVKLMQKILYTFTTYHIRVLARIFFPVWQFQNGSSMYVHKTTQGHINAYSLHYTHAWSNHDLFVFYHTCALAHNIRIIRTLKPRPQKVRGRQEACTVSRCDSISRDGMVLAKAC